MPKNPERDSKLDAALRDSKLDAALEGVQSWMEEKGLEKAGFAAPVPSITEVSVDPKDLQHAVRVACLQLGNFSPVKTPDDATGLKGTDTTLQYVGRENAKSDTEAILADPRYATMLSYSSHEDRDAHFHYLDRYAQAHAIAEKGSTTLTGPGVITMCAVNHLERYLQDRQEWTAAHRKRGCGKKAKAENSRISQAADTPVLLKVNPNQLESTACTEATLLHLQSGAAHGLIFQNARDLSAFAEWYRGKVAGQPGTSLIEGYKHFRFPTLVLRGEPSEIQQAILSGDAKDAHAFFFQKPLSQQQALELRNARATMMARHAEGEIFPNPFNQITIPGQPRRKGLEGTIHELKVAIVNVQGAARLEAAMIALASEKIPEMNVHLNLVQTRKQIEQWNPDALVLPGGWHFLQYAMQDHEKIGINEILGDIVREQRVHLLGSCAGAILMRQPDTLLGKSEDCVPETALGILPYLVRNNALSGVHRTQFLIHGEKGDQWIDFPKALFVSAPELMLNNKDALQVIARSTQQTYGVLQHPSHNDPVYAATALHNQLPYVYWLHEIFENMAVRSMRLHHGAIEGDVRG